MFVALIGVVAGSSYLSSTAASPEMFLDFAKGVSGLFARIYPLAGLYEQAPCWTANAWRCLPMSASRCSPSLLAGALFGHFFVRLNSFLTAQTRKKRFVLGAQKQRSPRAALLAREWRHFLSINSYVLNSAFGPILSLVAVIALAVLVPRGDHRHVPCRPRGLGGLAAGGAALCAQLADLPSAPPRPAPSRWRARTSGSSRRCPSPPANGCCPNCGSTCSCLRPLPSLDSLVHRLDLPRQRRGAGGAYADAGADGRILGARSGSSSTASSRALTGPTPPRWPRTAPAWWRRCSSPWRCASAACF